MLANNIAIETQTREITEHPLLFGLSLNNLDYLKHYSETRNLKSFEPLSNGKYILESAEHLLNKAEETLDLLEHSSLSDFFLMLMKDQNIKKL